MWIEDLSYRWVKYKQRARTQKSAVRADVDSQRPQKFTVGKKLRKKNAQGILQYNVSIVSARYDKARRSWMYTLKDWQNEGIDGETEETKLG